MKRAQRTAYITLLHDFKTLHFKTPTSFFLNPYLMHSSNYATVEHILSVHLLNGYPYIWGIQSSKSRRGLFFLFYCFYLVLSGSLYAAAIHFLQSGRLIGIEL